MGAVARPSERRCRCHSVAPLVAIALVGKLDGDRSAGNQGHPQVHFLDGAHRAGAVLKLHERAAAAVATLVPNHVNLSDGTEEPKHGLNLRVVHGLGQHPHEELGVAIADGARVRELHLQRHRRLRGTKEIVKMRQNKLDDAQLHPPWTKRAK